MLEHAGRARLEGAEAAYISPMAQIEVKLMTRVWRPEFKFLACATCVEVRGQPVGPQSFPDPTQSAGVDVRPAGGVGFRPAEYFAGYGCDFAATEEKKAEQLDCRVAFGPFEVDVRSDAGTVADIEHQ